MLKTNMENLSLPDQRIVYKRVSDEDSILKMDVTENDQWCEKILKVFWNSWSRKEVVLDCLGKTE